MKYELSIVIPIYNVENYIQECLESILSQLNPKIQIICVNDGSPDNSMEIAKKFIQQYSPHIQSQFVFIEQENKGLSGARNTGLKLARGKYIGFLDSDDKLTPNYFSEIFKVLEKDSYDIVDFNVITSSGKVSKVRNRSYDSVFSIARWYCPARIFKKTLFDNYNFTVGINYEDVDLTPILYTKASKTYHIDSPLYWYRDNEQGITKTFNKVNNLKTIESLDFICHKYLKLYQETNNPYYAIVAIQTYHLLCISTCRRFGLDKAFLYIKKYNTSIKDIEINNLPIDYESIDKRVLIFYRNPKTYCIAYKLFDKLRVVRTSSHKTK